MTALPAARSVLLVAYPNMGLLDLAAPQAAFCAASHYLRQRALQGYALHMVSLRGGPVRTAEGASLDTAPAGDFDAAEIDTLIVPGGPGVARETADQELIAWVAAASLRARRTASVSAGAFLLARAGLLDHRRVATHWTLCERLQQQYPLLAVDPTAIFVRQERIWTAAGGSSVIDLALAMIEEDCGRSAAMHVARQLVVFLRRPGSQAQLSEMLQAQCSDSDIFDELHLWLCDNLGIENLGVTVLAERVRMSPRNFARVYKRKTGRPPARAIELFRLEAAQRLLQHSDRNLDQIAYQCGFANQDKMRLTFHRNLGVSPSDYRKRFEAG